jgi:hypothetical protein
MPFQLPTPHGDKLRALLSNEKLPATDRPKVVEAVERYQNWLKQTKVVSGTVEDKVVAMVTWLNKYKRFVELDLIFDSSDNFLYRQKGQLKLDNTILEEFLPHLVQSTLFDTEKEYDLIFGPTTSFSGNRFESSITTSPVGGGMQLRAKAHDFAISRRLYIQASHQVDFEDSVVKETYIAYVAAECKTNLDKTMFQEAAATAADVKITVPGARYYLLCEWLDMTPINTNSTAIDEILVLRKAKRLSANIRSAFSSVSGRRENRDIFANFLDNNPLSPETFVRFVSHIGQLIEDGSENHVLDRGYF